MSSKFSSLELWTGSHVGRTKSIYAIMVEGALDWLSCLANQIYLCNYGRGSSGLALMLDEPNLFMQLW